MLRTYANTSRGSSGSSGANPTASVGLTAVNGVATTFLRSDGAPPLDQAIAPVWTGLHTFTNASGVLIRNTAPILTLADTTASAKSLVIQVDADVASFYEMSGSPGDILSLDLLNDRMGVGQGAPTALLHVGPGADAPAVASTILLVSANGATNLAIRDSTNDSELLNYIDGTTGIVGTRTNHPWTVRTNNTDRLTIAAAGDALFTAAVRSNAPTSGVGYFTGAGGSVTQLTSKSTSVTLDTVCGRIVMNNAALASSTTVSFTFNNSAIGTNDRLILNHVATGTGGAYMLNAMDQAAGSRTINVRNVLTTVGSLSEAIVIGFAVIKAVIT